MDIAPIIIAYCLPLGLTLIAWGSWDDERVRRQAATAVWVIALAAIAYAAIGFAFNFGGIGLRPDVPGGLRGLDRMWSPIGGVDGRGWGFLGVEGYLLNAQSTLPGDLALLFTQFLHQLPLVMVAALIPALALADRARLITISIITIIMAGVLVPILNAWAWGGGWLFMLGQDAKFGHGFIDPAGAATTLTAAGFSTLAALLALRIRRTPDQSSEGSPLKSIFGAIVFAIGWLAWLTTDPVLQTNRSIDLALAATNVIVERCDFGHHRHGLWLVHDWTTSCAVGGARPDQRSDCRHGQCGLRANRGGDDYRCGSGAVDADRSARDHALVETRRRRRLRRHDGLCWPVVDPGRGSVSRRYVRCRLE